MPAAFDAAIHANLNALALRLDQAESLAVEARAAIGRGRRYEAMGTILPLERIIPECEALVRSIVILHRAADAADKEVRA
jgi:hypothetical protein